MSNGLVSGVVMCIGADLAPEGRIGDFVGLWRLITDSGMFTGPWLLVSACGRARGGLGTD